MELSALSHELHLKTLFFITPRATQGSMSSFTLADILKTGIGTMDRASAESTPVNPTIQWAHR